LYSPLPRAGGAMRRPGGGTAWLAVMLVAVACGGASAAWFEVIGTKSAATAKLEAEGGALNVTLCDGDAANLTVSVEGGAPPWKVAVMRDGRLYTRVVIETSGFFQTTSGTAKLRLPLPGRYSLSRVCDLNGCNGTVSNQAIVLSSHRHPTAHILPRTPVCVDDDSTVAGRSVQRDIPQCRNTCVSGRH